MSKKPISNGQTLMAIARPRSVPATLWCPFRCAQVKPTTIGSMKLFTLPSTMLRTKNVCVAYISQKMPNHARPNEVRVIRAAPRVLPTRAVAPATTQMKPPSSYPNGSRGIGTTAAIGGLLKTTTGIASLPTEMPASRYRFRPTKSSAPA